MREARSIANALLAFALFLLAWAFFVPGYAGATHGPRFVRVLVEDVGGDHDGEPSVGHQRCRGHRGDRVAFSVPWAFVRGGLNAAATGRVRRELDLKLGDGLESEELKGVWKELSTSPEGTEVVREREGRKIVLSRKGAAVTIRIGHEAAMPSVPPVPQIALDGHSGTADVTIVLPAKLLEALAGGDEGLSPAALVEELRKAAPGDLVEVTADDGHVKVWLE